MKQTESLLCPSPGRVCGALLGSMAAGCLNNSSGQSVSRRKLEASLAKNHTFVSESILYRLSSSFPATHLQGKHSLSTTRSRRDESRHTHALIVLLMTGTPVSDA